MTDKLSIILVVGGWHTTGHAKPVTPYLEEHGYRVVPVALKTSVQHDPLPDIQDNVDPIVSAMKAETAAGNKICVIGHSVSGQSCVLATNKFLVTATAADKSLYVQLVFIACFLNPMRATADLDWYDIDISTMWAHLRTHDEIYNVFYNDMPREEAQPFIDMLDSNRAQMPPENIPDMWKQVKGTYFLCVKDKAIAPENQRTEAKENGMDLVELDMDHCCFVSRPKDFAAAMHKVLENL